MTKYFNRPIAGRLWCLGLTVLAIAAGVTWLNVEAQKKVSDRAHELVVTHMPQLGTISSLQDAVARRTLQLYLYYATMELEHWRELEATQLEFAELMSEAGLDDEHAKHILDLSAAFGRHAADFHAEMSSGSQRDWDVLREHLASAQKNADELIDGLARLADEIRESAGSGASRTMTQLKNLGQMQFYVVVVMLTVGLLVVGILYAKSRDQAELFLHAFHDRTTGLPNRARLGHDWKSRRQKDEAHPAAAMPCTLVTLQLDRYQLLTGTFGHTYGDGAVNAFATRLRVVCEEQKQFVAVYQLAAATWLVILAEISTPDSPAIANILAAFENSLEFDEHELSVTCSVGITHYPHQGQSINDLLRNCNAAMHRAQRSGGNSVVVYEPRMQKQVERFLSIESAMRKGLENEEFELFYQPKLRADNLSCAGAEALIRWRRNGQLISPGDFIPVAEESGLILPLGEWVLAEACRQWTQWRDAALSPPPVAINVSAQQFQSSDFVTRLSSILDDSGMPARMLELEITEEATFDDPRAVVATMRAAKQLGVALALDDFGTGYSSLSCLTSFPLDVIKIDRKFICEMGVSERILSIVEATVALSRQLGFKVVAEGVETTAQQERLQNLGCDYLQGFLFCRPIEAGEYARYFRQASQLNKPATTLVQFTGK